NPLSYLHLLCAVALELFCAFSERFEQQPRGRLSSHYQGIFSKADHSVKQGFFGSYRLLHSLCHSDCYDGLVPYLAHWWNLLPPFIHACCDDYFVGCGTL